MHSIGLLQVEMHTVLPTHNHAFRGMPVEPKPGSFKQTQSIGMWRQRRLLHAGEK